MSRLAPYALVTVLAGVFCWVGDRPQPDLLNIGILGFLTLTAELTALPVPGRGSLSHGFVWVFTMGELVGVAWGTIAALLALCIRGVVTEHGPREDRLTSLLTDALPYIGALLAMKVLASEPSHGFPAGWAASLATLVTYFGLGHFVLTKLYTHGFIREGLTEGASQARSLQMRFCAMLAPTTGQCQHMALLLAGSGYARHSSVLMGKDERAEGAARRSATDGSEGSAKRQGYNEQRARSD